MCVDQPIPTTNVVREALNHAIASFMESDDAYLIRVEGSERSVAHRLAIHLEAALPRWHVDCEFNRIGDAVKTLDPPNDPVSWYDDEAKTVYPDIIVHCRGEHGPNILVVEVKKMGVAGVKFDRDKLCAYTDPPLRYSVGALVRYTTGDDGAFRPIEWFAQGRPA